MLTIRHSFCATFFTFLLFFSQIRCGFAGLELRNNANAGELGGAMAGRVCGGRMGECSSEEEEEMESESNKRLLLMRRRYISYDTLERDLVPCEKPGGSYYDCQSPGVANAYGRGCEVITRCARGY